MPRLWYADGTKGSMRGPILRRGERERNIMPDEERPIVNVVGERVALGPIRRDLIPLYQRWFNDFGMLRTLAVAPQPMTIEAETAWYERAAASDPSITYFTI